MASSPAADPPRGDPDLSESATLPPSAKPAGRDANVTLLPSAAGDYSVTPVERGALSSTFEISSAAPVVPGYEILGVLGQGGMGVVYKARHLKLHRLVALKMIRGNFIERNDQRQRFLIEAEAVARLQHVNIVQIFEIGDVVLGDGSVAPFMALEFVDGEPLDRHLQGHPLSANAAAELVAALARAMEFAHERQIIHRDLKPANVLLAKWDSSSKTQILGESKSRHQRSGRYFHFCPKISDFGLAKQIDADTSQTKAGEIMGTPSYMAPEQAEAQGEVGPPADIYALGAILYELLTGRPPFRAATSLDTIFQVLGQEPVAPSKLQPGIPEDVETICLKCLQKPQAKRYASAGELADDLDRFLTNEPIRARPVSVWEKTWKWAKRRPSAAALVAVSALALIALVGGGIWFTNLVRLERDTAIKAEGDANDAKALAEAKARESQRHLDQLSLATGLRMIDGGDFFGGLVWLTRPLHKDVVYRRHEGINRDRITYHLQFSQRPTLRHSLWHDAMLLHAVFSPDGRRVVTSSADKTAQVWDAETGQAVGAALQHQDFVIKSVFSPDSRVVLTLSADKTARLWEAETGRARGPALPHPTEAVEGAFSPDGRLAFTISSGAKRLFLWETDTGQPAGEPIAHDDEVNFALFSPDGTAIMTAIGAQDQQPGAPIGKSGSVHFWDLATRTAARPPIRFSAPAWHIALSPDRQRAAIVWYNGLIRIVSLVQPDVPPIDIVREHCRRAFFTADGQRLVAFLEFRSAYVFDASTGRQVGQTIESGNGEFIRTLDVSPDGRMLVLGGDDKMVRVWSVETGQPLTPPLPQRNYIQWVSFSPDSRRLITASTDHTARIWDLAADQASPATAWHDQNVGAFDVSPDGGRIVTASWDRSMGIWDARTAKPIHPRIFHPERLKEAVYSRDGRWILSACFDGVARLWDASTFQLVREFTGHTRMVTTVRFSHSGERIYTTSYDGTSRIWDTASGECLHVLEQDKFVFHGELSPDGSLFFTGGEDRFVRLWNARTGAMALPRLGGHQHNVMHGAFSPDGRLLATASWDFSVRLWDMKTGLSVGAPMKHDGTVNRVAFSRDGRTLASMSEDNTTRLWDVTTGQAIAPPLVHPAWPFDTQFTADGERVVTGMRRWSARFWNAETGQPISPYIKHPSGRVLQVRLTDNESRLITCTAQGGLFIWPIPRDDRPNEDLICLAETLQGWRIDSFGGFATIPNDEYRAMWTDMRARYPADFSVSESNRQEWHRREMLAGFKEKKIYGALFHAWQAFGPRPLGRYHGPPND